VIKGHELPLHQAIWTMWLATKRPNSQNLCKRAYQAFKKAR